MTPRIFLVQNPSYFRRNRGWVPKFDLKPATDFGEIVELIPPGRDFTWQEVMCVVLSSMTGPNGYRPTDYILALGDPVAIAITVAIARDVSEDGSVSILKFDKETRRYTPHRVRFNLR